MTEVSPVFTEYEQQVVRELAKHRVQPNAVHRVLESVGKPMAKIMSFGRNSQNRALRGLADHLHGWIEEGLIKTFQVANKLTNTKDIKKRFAARGMQVGDDFESLRFMPLSQLDAVADSFRWGSSFLLGAEGALLGGATTMAEGIPGAVLNSSINLAFQQVGHQTAKDYFRRMLLEDRYGEDLVAYAIQQEVAVLKQRK